MTRTPPMTFERRLASYGIARTGWRLRATPAQRRRIRHKMHRAQKRRRSR